MNCYYGSVNFANGLTLIIRHGSSEVFAARSLINSKPLLSY